MKKFLLILILGLFSFSLFAGYPAGTTEEQCRGTHKLIDHDWMSQNRGCVGSGSGGLHSFQYHHNEGIHGIRCRFCLLWHYQQAECYVKELPTNYYFAEESDISPCSCCSPACPDLQGCSKFQCPVCREYFCNKHDSPKHASDSITCLAGNEHKQCGPAPLTPFPVSNCSICKQPMCGICGCQKPDCKKDCPRSPNCKLATCLKCKTVYCFFHTTHTCKCPFTSECSPWKCVVCTNTFCSKHQKHASQVVNCMNGSTHKDCGTPPLKPLGVTDYCFSCLRGFCVTCGHHCLCPVDGCLIRTCTRHGIRSCSQHTPHFCVPDPEPDPDPDPDPGPEPGPQPDPPQPPTPNPPDLPPPSPDVNNPDELPGPQPDPPQPPPPAPDAPPSPTPPAPPAPNDPVFVPSPTPGPGTPGTPGTSIDWGDFSGGQVDLSPYLPEGIEPTSFDPSKPFGSDGAPKFDFIKDQLRIKGQVAPVVSIPFPEICGHVPDLIIDFGDPVIARIVDKFRAFMVGFLYVGAIIFMIKIIRSLEF